LTGIGIKPNGKTITRFYDRGSGVPRINYLSAKANAAKADYEKTDKSGFGLAVYHNLVPLFKFPIVF
jgi:hypothetical protein